MLAAVLALTAAALAEDGAPKPAAARPLGERIKEIRSDQVASVEQKEKRLLQLLEGCHQAAQRGEVLTAIAQTYRDRLQSGTVPYDLK
jgi:hypothetical protein